MDEAVVDFQSLGVVQTPAGPRSRVVIVAVRREMIDRLVAATREAGLERRRHRPGRVRHGPRAGAGHHRAGDPLHQRRRAHERGRREQLGLPVHPRRRGRAGRLRAHARRAPRSHPGARAPVDAARRAAHAARGARWRRGARGRHARLARGGRAPARRHRAQLAELLPDAGGRRVRRARPADGPGAGHPRLLGAGSRSSSSCPSSPRSWSWTAPRSPSSTRPASRWPPGSPSTIASSSRSPAPRGRGAGGAVEQKLR